MAITNIEAINSYFNYEIPSDLVEKVMIDNAVTGTTEYSTSQTEVVELAVADICLSLINATSEKESEWGISYDKNQLKSLRIQLLKKWGKDENYGSSKINAASVW